MLPETIIKNGVEIYNSPAQPTKSDPFIGQFNFTDKIRMHPTDRAFAEEVGDATICIWHIKPKS